MPGDVTWWQYGAVKRSSASRGIAFGLAAAVAFGVSAPFAKRLLDDVEPQMLAGLLYLGAFAALALLSAARRTRVEARLRGTDLPRLVLLVIAGGVVAPVLLLLGLDRVSGINGSLLLNLEGPLTILLGLVVFGEHLSRRAGAGAVVVFAGAIVLGVESSGGAVDVAGALLIVAACACWALDNNLTQSLTMRDPRALVMIKTGVAGVTNVGIAALIGQRAPAAAIVLGALGLGALSYGLSVYWDAIALRELGAAREAAIFAVAPFVGALVAPFVLPESFSVREVVAGLLMAVGVALLLTEHHSHRHRHEAIAHEHAHEHDQHHQHTHDFPVAAGVRHSHAHVHEELEHRHEHVSDLHHRHEHGPED